MLARSVYLGLLVFIPFFTVGAQHQWTSLDGPYWANGIDVAVGDAVIA